MQSRLDWPRRHQSFPILTHMVLRYLERSIAQSARAYGRRCGAFRPHFTPQGRRWLSTVRIIPRL